jgi:hypothetical protein
MLIKKITISILTVLAILIACPSVWAATYFVDASVGNDSNSGTETTRAWRTISKVNSKSFTPGDIILFKRSQSWNETLIPRSGSSSAQITYGAYGVGDKPRFSNLNASGKSYVKVEGLHIETTSSSFAVLLDNSHHITIIDCDLYASPSSGTYAVLKIQMNSNNNKIIDCHIEHLQTNNQNDTVNIYYNSSYNLLEGNTIKGGTHTVVGMTGASDKYPEYESKYNIIRNNTIVNHEARPLSINTNSNYNLIENNEIAGGKDTAYCSGGQTFKLVTSNNIIRNNVIKESASNSAAGLGMIAYQYNGYPANHASNNRIYNNTFTELSNAPIILGNYLPDVCRVENNAFKNNAVFNNGGDSLTVKNYDSIRENYFGGNIFHKSGVSRILNIRKVMYSVDEIESTDSSHYFENQQVDPSLDSNLVPTDDSPALDGGVDLTVITSSNGSGSTFSVEDASYFSDGFNMIQGDNIVIGNSTVKIVSIDYSNNQITVSSSISWQKGQPVNLNYSGSKPDVGAFEKNNLGSIQPPTNLSITLN